jgi:hypothetical protein
VTGEDHNTDAIVAALRSPVLPAEQVGETAAMTAMLGVLQAGSSGTVGIRSRRGIAIAAVTVASLGVGGLVAAGPGFFTEANDPSIAVSGPSTLPDGAVAAGVTLPFAQPSDSTVPGTTAPETTVPESSVPETTSPEAIDAEVECEEGSHGATVSKVAKASESMPGKGAIVSAAAQSDCGKTGDEPAESIGGIVECADGNHGKTLSSVAQATESRPGKGVIVSEAAKSNCGKDDADKDEEKAEPQGNIGSNNGGAKPDDSGKPAGTGNLNN